MKQPRIPFLLASAIFVYSALSTAHASETAKHSTEPHAAIGKASYYADHFTGKRTASGERINPNRMTAASKTLPLGTHVKVTNLENGRTVHVTINDRGPYVRGRIIDLSQHAADLLAMRAGGVAQVEVRPEPATPAPGAGGVQLAAEPPPEQEASVELARTPDNRD